MKTRDFPYFHPSFDEFNIAQSAAVPYLDKDMNLVISFATAAGKSAMAECCFGYHLSTNEKQRVVYVCPLRSLAMEKYESWKNNFQFSRYGVALVTSDSKLDSHEIKAARLVIMTSESFDSKTRSEVYRKFLKEMSCVVIDEAHLIGTKHRGCAIEAALMRLTKMNPEARLVLLSATMGNAMELAKWIKSLNGKQTKCVTSTWRPVKVDMQYHSITDDEKVSKAVELAKESASMKTIVFVHSKATGADIAKRLKMRGVRCAFHNASVSLPKRKKIEEAFNNRMSGLNVLVATSTLSSGVNMGL